MAPMTFYQVKKFAHTLKTSQKSQIKKSLKSLNDYIRETGYKVAKLVSGLALGSNSAESEMVQGNNEGTAI